MAEKKTVLVVDDEREIAQGACLRLKCAGFSTLTASDGRMGVDTAAKKQPDAVVLDVRMPRMDGLTALGHLRVRADTRHIPVVRLSASLVDKQAALDSGARFFLTKPYDAPTLIAAIKAAVEERPAVQ